jgi:PIN domain nuclease of toxin-antitoxin system
VRILLDTHVLLWLLIEPKRLNTEHLASLRNPDNDVMFSAVSIWEIAIKAGLQRDHFSLDPAIILNTALASGYRELPLMSSVALQVANLPFHHRDPFDRLLVAQAIAEPAAFYTADRQLQPYSELVHLI